MDSGCLTNTPPSQVQLCSRNNSCSQACESAPDAACGSGLWRLNQGKNIKQHADSNWHKQHKSWHGRQSLLLLLGQLETLGRLVDQNKAVFTSGEVVKLKEMQMHMGYMHAPTNSHSHHTAQEAVPKLRHMIFPEGCLISQRGIWYQATLMEEIALETWSA